MARERWLPIAAWSALLLLACIVIARGRYIADLTAFLPKSPTASQRVLIAQLTDGIASRLVMAAVSGGDPESRAAVSSAMARQLRSNPAFRTVQNGESVENPADRAYVFGHRYVLSGRVTPGFFTRDGLAAQLRESVDLLQSSLGLVTKDLFVRDPTGETLDILSSYERGTSPTVTNGVWSSRDGTMAVLLFETAASGSDTDGQEAAIATLRAAFDAALPAVKAAAPMALRLSGTPVFSVDARDTIRSEAVRLSMVSAVLVILLLLAVYRSPRLVVLGMLPVASGAVAGVAAVALGFGVVHGVTLGFGVTLIGEAVDYSVYLFLQRGANQTDSRSWVRNFWPTVQLGLLTSVIGFGALLTSSFPGLAQLGCYTLAGLVAAGLTTRYVLPVLLPSNLRMPVAEALGTRVLRAIQVLQPWRRMLWAVPVLAVFALLHRGGDLWNRELSALMPVPAEARAFDTRLRAELGASDAGTVVVVQADSIESALQGAEVAGSALEPLVRSGALAGFQSPASYIPSQRAQRLRRSVIPEPAALHSAFDAAIADLPVLSDQFGGFFEDAEAARHAAPITPADVDGTTMGVAVRALLFDDAGRRIALLPLIPPSSDGRATEIDIPAVTAAVAALQVDGASVSVLQVKRESDSMYGAYLQESLKLAVFSTLAVVLLLAWRLRSIPVLARVMLPLALSLLTVTSVFALAGKTLTLLHLVGFMLVVAIGSNYTLILQRKLTAAEPAAVGTAASLVVANLTAVIGFGVLASSSVPFLSDVGSTVAPGVLLTLLYGALLAPLPGRDGA